MPGQVVVEGAALMCPLGTAPAALIVTSQPFVVINGLRVATVADCAPVDNIPPFGTCTTLTAAASGVPTPCVPAPTGTWAPGSLVRSVNDLPVLLNTAKLPCGVGGCISITSPGQVQEESD